MKRFLLRFFIGFIMIHYVYSFRIIQKKSHDPVRRCICLKINSSCQCNNERQPEFATHQQLQQFYREEPLAIVSTTERNSNVPQQSMLLPPCIPTCLQKCMKKQYSRCQQSCQNMCKVEQSIPSNQLPQTISQQQQQQHLFQMIPEYSPIQHQTWESNVQKDSAIPISEIQLNTSIPMIAVPNTSILLTESNKLPSSISSNSIGQLNIPYGQFFNNNNNICTQACMPSCQCTQQNISVTAPILQHQPPVESDVHQPLLSEGSLRQESTTYNNNNVSQVIQTPCNPLCMPFCRDQCIHQTAILPNTFYSTPSPAPSLIPQSQPTIFDIRQFEQQYSSKAEKIPTNEAHKTQHSSICIYICQDNCMQQCMQQNRSAEQCNYTCHVNCAQQQEQQQQLLQLIQGQEFPQPIHQQLQQQIPKLQYPSSFTQIQQVQQIPINGISREQLLSQQVSGVPRCILRAITPAI